MVNPQQKSRSTKQPKSLSATDGSVFVVCFGGIWGDGPAADTEGDAPPLSASSSSSSSSSITNWVVCSICSRRLCPPAPSSSPPPTTTTTSLFHSTSLSNTLGSLSSSKITGRTRCKTRRQFRTSLVALRSAPTPPPPLMSDDAKEVTTYFVVGAEGNVWSETRLKRREVTTRTSVTMFSGASSSARRTVADCSSK